jgi:hypothetical protein
VSLSAQSSVIGQTAGGEWLVTDRDNGHTYVLVLDGSVIRVSASTALVRHWATPRWMPRATSC